MIKTRLAQIKPSKINLLILAIEMKNKCQGKNKVNEQVQLRTIKSVDSHLVRCPIVCPVSACLGTKVMTCTMQYILPAISVHFLPLAGTIQ